ncbi:hypothetical protein AWV80_32980 [Cupriavidus sp. UYMU48A]|nr:hypothetical protein AWV80_32980 [Cupriavidus sp. UYMU48A]
MQRDTQHDQRGDCLVTMPGSAAPGQCCIDAAGEFGGRRCGMSGTKSSAVMARHEREHTPDRPARGGGSDGSARRNASAQNRRAVR